MRDRLHRVAPRTRDRARQLRRDPPVPERILWGLLRGRRLGGLKFRRQHEVGPYVADFCCMRQRLIVELDGLSHIGRAEADDARTRYLEDQGYRVVRFTNDDLLHHPDAVADAIARAAGLNW